MKIKLDLILKSFGSQAKTIYLLLVAICVTVCILLVKYISNYANGKFTDYMILKNIPLIIKFLFLCIFMWFLFAILDAIRDYIAKKLHIIMRYNLYNYLGCNALDDLKYEFPCQKMSVELDNFSSSFLRLFGYFIEAIISFPLFIFVLYGIGGYKIIILTFGYSIFGQIISGYLANFVHLSSYKTKDAESDLRRKLIVESQQVEQKKLPSMQNVIDLSVLLYKNERLLAIFRNIFNDLKNYIPYAVLIIPYLNGTITFGDTVRAIGAFRYVMRSIGFVTDNRGNLIQFNVSVQRINELRK